MATGFDDLVERLLYDVALAGDGGLGIQELANAVQAFYPDSKQGPQYAQTLVGDDLLFSEAPPDGKPVVDDSFVELVWQWVSNHPEVSVKHTSHSKDTIGGAQQDDASLEDSIQLSPTVMEKYAGKRLTTGEERVWYAITGHGVDFKRVPKLEFECLKCVAAHGSSGVLQPDITGATGQDKRSVPKRTDSLVKNGYVTKTSVIARGSKTSLIKLTKFANQQGALQDGETPPGTTIIQYNLWFDKTIKLIQENDDVIAFEDLRNGLGILGKKFETRAFHRCIRRLAAIGCLRKVRAKLDPSQLAGPNAAKTVRSLQLLRKPNDTDRTCFMGKDWGRNKRPHRLPGPSDWNEDQEDPGDEDADADFEYEDDVEDVDLAPGYGPPAWNRDLPFTNLLHHRVADTGQNGVISAGLHKKVTGPFWKRQLDDMLSKTSDLWQHSQPPHLRHLAIIKDTAMSIKQPVYRFRTYNNYAKAVESGQASWEGVLGGDSKGNGKKKNEIAATAQPGLDDWGFPKLSTRLFVDHAGQATLAECRMGPMKETNNFPKPPASHKKRKSSAISTPRPTARLRVSADTTPVSTPQMTGPKRLMKFRPTEEAHATKLQRERMAAEDAEYAVSVRALAERRIRRGLVEAGLTVAPDAGAECPGADYPATPEPPSATHRPKRMSTRRSLSVNYDEAPPPPPELLQDESSEAASPAPPAIDEDDPIIKAIDAKLPPKKRGRPSKAMVAERERLIREAQAKAEAEAAAKAQAEAEAEAGAAAATPSKRKRGKTSKAAQADDDADDVDAAVEPPPPKKKRGRPSNAELARRRSEAVEAAQRALGHGSPQQDHQESLRQVDSSLSGKGKATDRMAGSGSAALAEFLAGRPNHAVGKRNPAASTAGAVLNGDTTGDVEMPDAPPAVGTNAEQPTQSQETALEEATAVPPNALSKSDLEARVAALASELLEASKPGVYINPPSALRLKSNVLRQRGRKPKALIAVFKMSGLKEKEWFVEDAYEQEPGRSEVLPDKIADGGAEQQTPAQRSLQPVDGDARAGAVQAEDPWPDTTTVSPAQIPDRPNGPDTLRQTASQDTSLSQEPIQDKAHPPVQQDKTKKPGPRKKVPPPYQGAIDPSLQTSAQISMARSTPPPATENVSKRISPMQLQKRLDAGHDVTRKKIVIDTLKANDGIFPAGRSMWYAFSSAWRKQDESRPDGRTIDVTMKKLISSNKIKKLTFMFKSRKGFNEEGSIFALKEVDTNSPKVKAMQKEMINIHPAILIPEVTFKELLPEYQAQLDRNKAIIKNVKDAPVGSLPKEHPHIHPHYETEFPEDSSVTVKRLQTIPTGFAPTEADIQRFKDARQKKIVVQKRFTRSKKPVDSDPETDEDDAPISQEQSAMQGQIQLSGYQHEPGRIALKKSRSSKISRQVNLHDRAGKTGGLPGRVLKRKPEQTTTTPSAADPRAIAPAELERRRHALIGAVTCFPSQAAHSQLSPDWVATSVPETVGNLLAHSELRNTSLYADNEGAVSRALERWKENHLRVEDTTKPSDEGFYQWAESIYTDLQVPRAQEEPTFGLMLPDESELIFPVGASSTVDAEYLPRSLEEMMDGFHEEDDEHRSQTNEAEAFWDEVDCVEAWEKLAIKEKRAFVRLKDQPFINYTTPSMVTVPAKWVRLGGSTVSASNPMTSAPGYDLDHPNTKRQKRKWREFEIDEDPNNPAAGYRYKSRVKTGTHVDDGSGPKTKKRDRKSAGAFGEREYDRLTKAVALVWALVGGLSGKQNWYIVAHVLSYRYDSEFLRHRWDKVRKDRDSIVKQMQEKIWEPFLEAYERGELPTVDFGSLKQTDWPALLDWVETNVLKSNCFEIATTAKAIPELPALSEDLTSRYDVEMTDGPTAPDRGEIYTAGTEKRRKDLAGIILNGNSLNSHKSVESTYAPGHALLRSWVRAIALTEDVKYDAELAHKKLTQFDDKTISTVCAQMQAEKYLHEKKKGRRLPGRNLDMVDDVFRQFRRWPGKEIEFQYLPTVAAHRTRILDTLSRQETYTASYTADDEEVLVLTNMVAQGLLHISSKIPERNDDFDAPYPRLSAWGYNGLNYNVRTFDKSRLRFTVQYAKSPTFTTRHGLKSGVPVPMHPPLLPGDIAQRTPIWVDIHDNLLPQMFEATMRSILHLLVFRPGITAVEMERVHKHRLWVWEIEVLMPWMEESGLAVRVMPGEEEGGVWKGGWRAGEWWYCVLCEEFALWRGEREVVEVD